LSFKKVASKPNSISVVISGPRAELPTFSGKKATAPLHPTALALHNGKPSLLP